MKCGSRGLIHISIRDSAGREGGLVHPLPDGRYLVVVHYEPLMIPEGEVVSTTGAGDTLVGGLVAGLLSGEKEDTWVARAMERVGRTMRSHRAVG